jgi:hypothetical protein
VHEFDLRTAEHVRAPERAESSAERRNANPVEVLQTTIGNAAVGRLLHRSADEASLSRLPAESVLHRSEEQPEEEELNASHDTSPTAAAGTVHRAADGSGEEEEELQALHDPQAAVSSNGGAVRRSEDEEVPEDQVQASHDPLQRAPEVGLAGGPVSENLAARIDGARGGGAPLDDPTRSLMEDTLGTDLGSVRVHVGRESDELNHAITAKAFTTGNDVFVRSDQWAPGSSSTQRLLAHELTHVAQQRSGEGSEGSSGMSVGASDSAAEHEAEAVADSIG